MVGIFRPLLLLPAGMVERFAPQQLASVLAHEMCHVRRRDNLTAAVHMIVEAVFWFHPLVWWISARLMEERERACDEAVLELGSEPQVYAESILKTCEFCVESPLTCMAGITGADLRKRIVRIMTEGLADQLGFGRKLMLMTLAIAVIAGPMMVGLVRGPQILARGGEAAGPRPQFEVASIKRNRSGELNRGVSTPRGRFIGRNLLIRPSIAWAYRIPSFQVIGGPGWLDSDDYNIEAKVDEAETEKIEKLYSLQRRDQIRLMLRSLFAERFQLKVSHQTREGPAYALVVTKDGPKFRGQIPGDESSKGVTVPSGVTSRSHAMGAGPGGLRGLGISMAELAGSLSGQVGRPVLDQTGLKGVYDILLHWTPEPGAMVLGRGNSGADAAPLADISGPSIFAAIQEQLGLKLEPTKAPMEMIVIDHIERPSEN